MDNAEFLQYVGSGASRSLAHAWPQSEHASQWSNSPSDSEYSHAVLYDEPASFGLHGEILQPVPSQYCWNSITSEWTTASPETFSEFDGQSLLDFSLPTACPYLAVDSSATQITNIPGASRRRTPLLSIASTESETGQERDGVQQQCGECNGKYDSLQALDKHARERGHKAWRCPVSDCDKVYVRRDVFLRHRSTHREGGFRCSACRKVKQYKQFKRKDHFKEHLRKCHPGWSSDSSGSQDLPDFKQLLDNAEDQHGIADEYTSRQKERFRVIVGSLRSMLPESHMLLIERLEDSVESLSGPTMETLAENMAGAALVQASLTTAKGC